MNYLSAIYLALFSLNAYSVVDIDYTKRIEFKYSKTGLLYSKKCINKSCTPYIKTTGKNLREYYANYNFRQNLNSFFKRDAYPIVNAFDDKVNIFKRDIDNIFLINNNLNHVSNINDFVHANYNQCFYKDMNLSLADEIKANKTSNNIKCQELSDFNKDDLGITCVGVSINFKDFIDEQDKVSYIKDFCKYLKEDTKWSINPSAKERPVDALFIEENKHVKGLCKNLATIKVADIPSRLILQTPNKDAIDFYKNLSLFNKDYSDTLKTLFPICMSKKVALKREERIKTCDNFDPTKHSDYHPCNSGWNLRFVGIERYDSKKGEFIDYLHESKEVDEFLKMLREESDKEKVPGFLLNEFKLNGQGEGAITSLADTGISYTDKAGLTDIHPEISDVDREDLDGDGKADFPLIRRDLATNVLDPEDDKEGEIASDKLDKWRFFKSLLPAPFDFVLTDLFNHGSNMTGNIASSEGNQEDTIFKNNPTYKRNYPSEHYVAGYSPQASVEAIRSHVHPSNTRSTNQIKAFEHVLNKNLNYRNKILDTLVKNKFMPTTKKEADAIYGDKEYCKVKTKERRNCQNKINIQWQHQEYDTQNAGCWMSIYNAKCDSDSSENISPECKELKHGLRNYYRNRSDSMSMSFGIAELTDSKANQEKLECLAKELTRDDVVLIAASGNTTGTWFDPIQRAIFDSIPPCKYSTVICMGGASAALTPWSLGYNNKYVGYVMPSDTIKMSAMNEDKVPRIEFSSGTSYATSGMAGAVNRIIALKGKHRLDMNYKRGHRTAFVRLMLEEAYDREIDEKNKSNGKGCIELGGVIDIVENKEAIHNKDICAFSSYRCLDRNYASSKSDAANNVKLESIGRLSCGKLMNKGFSHTEKVITNFPKIAMLKSKDGKRDYMPSEHDIEIETQRIYDETFELPPPTYASFIPGITDPKTFNLSNILKQVKPIHKDIFKSIVAARPELLTYLEGEIDKNNYPKKQHKEIDRYNACVKKARDVIKNVYRDIFPKAIAE